MVKGTACGLMLLAAGALSAASESGYAGSKVCAGCHRQIYDNYIRTAMGQSMRPAGGSRDLARLPAPVTIPSGNHFFEVRREGNALYQSEYEPGPAEEPVFRTRYKLEYAVGSGVNGSTYIVKRGRYLFEAPLSYFVRTKTWELSPGYEAADPGFGRPIAAGCIACHSGRPQPVRDREGLFDEPPFQELAIGCENCHGPGALHVRERGNRKAIVNPARLPAQLAEDICMSCHQAGDARVLLPGRDYADFRPGTALSETLAIFVIPPASDGSQPQDLLDHHFAMRLSKCFAASEGRLSCLTCHNPHSIPSRENAGAYYRKKCLTCHAENSCSAPRERRVREASDHCVQCHMPKREIGMISHSALTNHRIVTRSDEALAPQAVRQTASDLPDLIFLNRAGARSAPNLTLLQAYGELVSRAPRYRSRYFELLGELSQSAANEPVVQAALGRKAFLESGPEANREAIQRLSKAIQLGFTSSTVYENLAEALVREGRTSDAVEALKKGLELMPFSPRLHKFLAARYIDLKEYPRAKQVMERYLELFPDDDFVRGLLRKLQP
jgi:hypothetical protein